MSHEVFTEPWARAWAGELRGSDPYRRAARKWEGSLVLEMATDPAAAVAAERAVYADLWHGECRDARVATAADRADADYVIRAGAEVWQRVLAGQLEPIFGLVSGKLRLARGRLARLTPYAKASRELVRAAARVDSHFPAERAPQAPAEPVAARPAAADRAAQPPQPAADRVYQTTSSRGLDHDTAPMRLWHKAKKVGIWDPRDIDFTRDQRDWRGLTDLEREVVLHLTSLFQAGEESVTLDLLPLIQTVAGEGRLEEEIYLTSFLWEEAKHVEVFRRFLDEVAVDASDLSRFHGPSYRRIFYDELPRAMGRLRHDPSPAAQAEASVTYNMIVEGVLAETGYHAYHRMLERRDLLPGMRRAVAYLKSDEARHLAYGVHLLTRLVEEGGEGVWKTIEARMGELLPAAIGLIHELFDAYEEMPFGLELDEFTDFAMAQFQRRFDRIEKARTRRD
jgi:ribonucleoside-diphosphate reductase beta chain